MKHVRTILKVGNSAAVTIPPDVLADSGLKPGDLVVVIAHGAGGMAIQTLEAHNEQSKQEKAGGAGH